MRKEELQRDREEHLTRYPQLRNRREPWGKPTKVFRTVGTAVEFFNKQKVSDMCHGVIEEDAGIFVQCILTEGPDKIKGGNRIHKLTRTAFSSAGVRVYTSGEWGNRIITVRGFKARYVRSERGPR